MVRGAMMESHGNSTSPVVSCATIVFPHHVVERAVERQTSRSKVAPTFINLVQRTGSFHECNAAQKFVRLACDELRQHEGLCPKKKVPKHRHGIRPGCSTWHAWILAA
jgi:hypothetical protein